MRILYIFILLTLIHSIYAQDVGRASIKNETYSVTADSIEIDGKNRAVKAEGAVEITDIDKYFAAQSLFMKYEKNFNGEMHNVTGYIKPFYITGKILTFAPDGSASLQNGSITTCKSKKPHYCFIAENLGMSPDHRVVYLNRAGLKLFGMKLTSTYKYEISLGESGKEKTEWFPFLVGYSQADGLFLSFIYNYPIVNDVTTVTRVQYGTGNFFRASETVAYNIPVKILKVNPEISVTASYHERSPYGVSDNLYRDQSYNRMPESTLIIPGIKIFKLGGQWALTGKVSFGEYHESISGYKSTRGDGLLVLSSPRKIIGDAAIGLVLVDQQFYYPGITRNTNYYRLIVDKKKNEGFYWKVAYQKSHDTGGSPFYFDRIVLSNQLETGVEFDLWKNSPYRLNITNINDLNTGKSNDLLLKLKYSLDCMSFSATYSHGTGSTTFGVDLNL